MTGTTQGHTPEQPRGLICDRVTYSPDGRSQVLQEVSFDLKPGACAILAGRNGAGKTMLLKLCAGLIRPDHGRITLNGNEIRKPSPAVGMVFQDPDTGIIGQTVEDDVAFGLSFMGLSGAVTQSRVDRTLDLVGLSWARHLSPYELSGGEKRRLSLAASLVTEPDWLLLDEPFSHLDWEGGCSLIRALLDLNRSGIGIVLTAHDLSPFLAHAGRVLVLDNGRLILDDEPASVLDLLQDCGIRRPPGELRTMTWLPS
jgi:biotin transport system ATP-binding protein